MKSKLNRSNNLSYSFVFLVIWEQQPENQQDDTAKTSEDDHQPYDFLLYCIFTSQSQAGMN